MNVMRTGVGLVLMLGVALGAQAQEPQEPQEPAKPAARPAPAPAPSLTPSQQSLLLVNAYTEAIQQAAQSVGAKACKAAKGTRFALVVVNGQAGWSCEIDLGKVKP